MGVSITILGCGSSGGVPRVGQGLGACDPANAKNRRRRCSVMVERAGPGGTTSVLVDTSPDLREQLLDAGTRRLDGIVLTHSHADHTHGIDDILPLVLVMHRKIDLYMDAETSAVMRTSFRYIFESPPGSFYHPLVMEHRLAAGHVTRIEGPGGEIDLLPFQVAHGEIDALGLRIGNIAYTPDVCDIPDASLPFLADLDVWIIDCLRYAPHPSHFSFSDAMGWIDRLKPKRAILTNLHTDLDYDALSAQLPETIVPAYDGMTVTG